MNRGFVRRLDIATTASSDDVGDAPTIFVSQACLIIPVFIAAWWYYTKHACRNFVRGLLKNGPEEHCRDDDGADTGSVGHFTQMEETFFQTSWRDGGTSGSCEKMDGVTSASSPSNRFVKWINRRNVRRQFEKQKLKRTTQKSLFGGRDSCTSDPAGNNHDKGASPEAKISPRTILSDKSLVDTFDEEEADGRNDDASGNGFRQQFSPKSSSKQNFQRSKSFEQWECIPSDSHIELCSMHNDVQNDDSIMR
ncbi:hypothetical protein IV203_028838 [Nitzschia inconspicua]|uniref:Uncharacterized protein n=1 Tax=Nitzschia inconspicua TaxID=303405 RepID=A0A9K3K8J0_9STRA|nr:hypothetical protein IV203_004773 [Nitzschia inconspicua]KAG7366168.1 hypothetical protein IV203_028838 [Nitzschia inconspicua]